MLVSQQGDGDYTTIGEAIANASDYTDIFIKSGIYNEKIVIKQKGISLYGEDGAAISYNDSAFKLKDGKKMGTFESYTILILGEDFYAENMAFENYAGFGSEVGQAVAVFVNADKAHFKNCSMFGRQDTLCTGPIPNDCKGDTHDGIVKYEEPVVFRNYFEDCFIQGDVDFIFGGAVAIFDRCTIKSLDRGEGTSYVTASSTHKDLEFGYVFRDCDFTANARDNSVTLGRPWRPFSKTVFINCSYGPHIQEAGFSLWNDRDEVFTAYYAEYEPKTKVGYDKRIFFAKQISDEEIKKYTTENIFKDWK